MFSLRTTKWGIAAILAFALTGLFSDPNGSMPTILGKAVDEVNDPALVATVRHPSGPRDSEPQAARVTTVARADPAIVTNTQQEAASASPAPTVTSAPITAPPPRSVAVPTPAPPVAAPTPTPAPTACPTGWFCYPRIGIAGPIVAYSDCSGSSDVGLAIRSFTCLSQTYLMGHAYTSFGGIVGWRAGDIVFAYGKGYTVTGAIQQSSCAAPVLPLAPLSMQTSLSPTACGPVLVVQAR